MVTQNNEIASEVFLFVHRSLPLVKHITSSMSNVIEIARGEA